jgi:MraZ protein
LTPAFLERVGVFLGEFTHSIDNKGRLTIPAKFRAELAQGLVMTHGIDHCLAIYSLSEWDRLSTKVSALPVTDRRARSLRRLVFANACDAALDRQGRVIIPLRLRQATKLDGDVVGTGLDTYIEVWNPQDWEREREHVAGDEAAYEQLAGLGI